MVSGPYPFIFVKAVFHKFYLVHSLILCPIYQSDEPYENFFNLDNNVPLHQRHLMFSFLKFSRVCLKQIPSLYVCVSQVFFVVKPYRIIYGKGLLCHCHLQSLHYMERIMCILKVHSLK